MASLTGKTVLITGATSGIGLEAAVKIARMGAELVIVGRDRPKAEAALEQVKNRSGSGSVALATCDFSSQAQIRALAADFKSKHHRLDVLINNAGSVSPTRQLTVDGVEQTFAVNHLAYFLLTHLLLDLLRNSAPARVVSVASVAHRGATLDFDNLQYEKGGYQILKAYARSKLAVILWTRELARRLEGSGVTVSCLQPGTAATHIWSKAPWYARPFLAIAKLFMISAEKGGDRVVYLATSPEVEGQTGGYYEVNRPVDPSRLGRDEDLGKKIWEVSEQLVGLSNAANAA